MIGTAGSNAFYDNNKSTELFTLLDSLPPQDTLRWLIQNSGNLSKNLKKVIIGTFELVPKTN